MKFDDLNVGLCYEDKRGNVLKFISLINVDIGDKVTLAEFMLLFYVCDGELVTAPRAEFYLTEFDIFDLTEVDICQ